jgi:hypothetical protein
MPEAMMTTLTRFVLSLISRLLALIEPPVQDFSLSLADIPRRKGRISVDIGNRFFDLVAGIHVVLAPNGALDGPPDVTVSPDDLAVSHTSPDGGSYGDLEFDVLFPERDVPSFSIIATAPADNPSTPDLESVSVTITGSLTHSKATSLGATVTDIPR